jgi:hypothetical protein
MFNVISGIPTRKISGLAYTIKNQYLKLSVFLQKSELFIPSHPDFFLNLALPLLLMSELNFIDGKTVLYSATYNL